MQLTDGSFADAAVHSLADGSGALSHGGTKAAFARNPCSPCRICSTATTPRPRES
ncbi:MAG: hypothetical protein ACLS69_07090 [Butyricicoccus sp.]